MITMGYALDDHDSLLTAEPVMTCGTYEWPQGYVIEWDGVTAIDPKRPHLTTCAWVDVAEEDA